uniref:Uncharacterized protein n=1 Tax=Oryza rufipogon TaxID=4529 RepID=A0A0E0MZY0_ORYRU
MQVGGRCRRVNGKRDDGDELGDAGGDNGDDDDANLTTTTTVRAAIAASAGGGSAAYSRREAAAGGKRRRWHSGKKFDDMIEKELSRRSAKCSDADGVAIGEEDSVVISSEDRSPVHHHPWRAFPSNVIIITAAWPCIMTAVALGNKASGNELLVVMLQGIGDCLK